MTLIDGEELRALLAGVGIVGHIDAHAVIRRDSVLELVDRRLEGARSGHRAGSLLLQERMHMMAGRRHAADPETE